jgi:TonB family protein
MKSLAILIILLATPFCAVAQKSHIQVVSEPGISVLMDGQFKGITTVDQGGLILQNVNSGQHTIRVIKEGFTPREYTLTVQPGEVIMLQVDKNFVPAIRITEEGNNEKQRISIKKGNLTIQSLPISISIQIPSVGVNYIKQADKFHAENIPEGTYLVQFVSNEKVLLDSIKILNEMVTYLFVNMVELKIENKDYKYISESSKSNYRIEEERRLNEINDRTNNAFGNAGNLGKSGTSQGIAGGEGNQGVEIGSPGALNYGPREVIGDGAPSYRLGDRRVQSLPVPRYDNLSEGIVVVEISVDRKGNVTKAVAGVKGSTTLDEYLLREARDAAMKAKFNSNDNAPMLQKGTITYNFRLK